MADVGASDAVKIVRGLRCNEKKINEVVDHVMSIVSALRRSREFFNHSKSDLFDEDLVSYVAHEIEDVLETFVVDAAVMLQKNEARWFIKRFLSKYFPALNDGFVLRNIKANFSKVDFEIRFFLRYFGIHDTNNIHDEPWIASQDQRWLRQTYPRGIEEHFVGMDDELEELVALVVEKKNQVISIWGVAGLGKTTIASKIYKQPDVRSWGFNAFAWVYFSQGCPISILLLSILRQLSPRQVNETTQEETVMAQLKEFLSWRRCLIVLDNVQDMDQWTQLLPALHEVELGRSVILLTTREENIANVGFPHKLRLLREDEAWELLKGHAFPRKDGPDVGLFPRLGKEMVQKCGFLPSAISRLGKILSSKNSLDEWQMINDHVSEHILDHQTEEDEKLVTGLDWKYQNLPYYLRQCFLYLGNFSEDEEIDVEDLYFLWIAEGMVSSVNEQRKKTIMPDLVNEKETRQDIANEDREDMMQDIANHEYREEMMQIIENEDREETIANVDREETTQDIANEDREEITPDVANVDREETIPDIRNEEDREEKTPQEITLDVANVDREETIPDIGNEEDREEITLDIANEHREEPALDIAEKYLNELASREMILVQQDELSAIRRFHPCFLHSPARELSSWEEEKANLRLEITDFCSGKEPMLDGASIGRRTRRLIVRFNQQAKLEDLPPMDILRSLFLFNSGKKFFESPLKISDIRKFKLLRVLNFVRCKFNGRKLCKGIHKLLNLRYLGLLYCDLDELPPSVGNLRNLRVLNVRVLENYHLRIPNVLHKLVLLNHLRLPYCTDREQTQKLKLGDLLELETLFGFNSLIHDLDSLSKLNKLRLLGAHAYSNDSLKSLLRFITSHGVRIRTKLFIENKCDFTSKEGVAVLEEVLMCPNLHALTLSMVVIYKVPDCGIRVSSYLTELKLIGCKITEDPMEAFGKFPNLQKLCLGHGAFVGREMTVQANGFPNLAYLEIRSLPYFEEWRLDEGAMRNLSELKIRRCPRLKMIPDGLVSISNLKNMEIELAPEAFVDASVEEYLQKFHFVTSLKIRRVDPCSTS